ncbi:MAG: hypothetical protein CMJ85_05955 [Planctomycetes bacterium]|nr:hypothetical protein [Planctomycetota bacterium]MDP6425296.1 UvrB/UvrC motif-containing protein [Planctomycetota bacterium]
MLCQNCQQAQATIHSLDKDGSDWVAHHHCEKCAMSGGPEASVEPGKIIKLFGDYLAQADSPAPTLDKDTACAGCGLGYEQFQQSRRLGCARCYETFAPDLEQIFLRVQERTMHKGKAPGRPQTSMPSPLELRRLRENLQQAVDEERFEDAAGYRDKLQQLSDELGE